MTSFWRVAAVGIAIVAAGMAGFLARRAMEPDRRGHAPTPAVRAPPPAQKPARIPAFTLPDLQGRPRQSSEWAGRPLIVNFWATWCEPCRREIPLLRELRSRHASAGLEVLGIAMDFPEEVAAYVQEAGIEYPILVAEQDALAAQAFGVGMGLPTSVFVDRDGKIVATQVGELRKDEAEALLGRVLNVPWSIPR